MHHWNDHMDGSWGWGWIPMVVMMGVLVILAAWIVVTLLRRDHHPASAGPGPMPPPDPARRILDERFARGEIDDEEYTRRRRMLEGGP
jgi:putative membrane protein